MSGDLYANCTHVSPQCPVEGELYGYAPNLAVNFFFTAFFGVGVFFHLAAGIRYHTWSFMTALVLGCLCEGVGYAGRVIMHYNVWNNTGLQIQIDCLIQGPAYISAGIYFTLKHIVLNIDQRYSRVKAARYTWIFISGDMISLCIQGVGGGIAAAKDNENLATGTNIMIAGIIFQVVVLVFFGYLLIEYFTCVFRHRDELAPKSLATLESRRFRWFMVAIVVAFLGILTRCVYRIPELLGGWGNSFMRKELPFIILEGVLICLSTLVLSVFHPGWCFPAMADKSRAQKNKDGQWLPSASEADYQMSDRG